MAIVVKDRVRVTSTTTGTGTFTLGSAVDGFQDFSVIGAEIPKAWNLALASYSGISFSVAAQDTSPEGLFFKPDGTKMYVVGSTGDDINEYSLSTPWLASSASYVQNFSVATESTIPTDLFFKPDGTKMYVVDDSGNDVNEYDLGTPWDISSASYLQTFSVAGQQTNPFGLFFKPDGTKMYTCGTQVPASVQEYDLSTAWDISSASFVQNFLVNTQESNPRALSFKTDGTKMYVAGHGNDVNEYALSTPWNISTSTYAQNFSTSSQDFLLSGLFFKPGGEAFYITGRTNDTVYQYNIATENQTYYAITDGTDWEVGIGSVSYDGTTLSRNTILESSNSNAAVDWPAGDKDVIVTFPSENTQGTVPTGDNSSVGTDLVAWLNLKKTLDAGVVNGVPYANNGTNGIVSTFSLVYTVSGMSRGGVLASNGDVHFIPHSAPRGQKINYLTGVVSTYSLVYTTASAYVGGVLAPNGDIHFVPASANRGQKISASGVVSTYSLVYTGTDVYYGGVLAPNGDIHFIPYTANRGQKVSAAGTVSTYSLLYTTGDAYSGGVLAPNGDIHFVPDKAAVGQKISAAGVVSTYSLVYTNGSGAYNGGVLAPNGDIYFIPYYAAVGQKISASGVVSTYSLVYTTSIAYDGGVLAPNGDIHFMPRSANRGQKISPDGVVSTYSLLVTGTNAYHGGILAPNGDIYFINLNNGLGQKISTGVQVEPGFALSPFFNKF
jgi:hypothetical protein